MTASEAPARCKLDQIADHQFVSVEARITAVTFKDLDTDLPWAQITLTDGKALVDVNVFYTTFALCSEHLHVGNEVIVSGEVGLDADGLFLRAHTIHQAGGQR